MNRRDIVIGLIILIILAAIVFWVRRPKVSPIEIPPATVEEQVENKFNLQIPEDVEKTELKDVTGGTAFGIATRKFAEGAFSHSVLADLPDPKEDEFYEGWLVKGDEIVSTGKMSIAKGGYMLEFSSKTDYTDYNQVVITLETIFDKTPEKHILEGSF